MSTPTLWTRTTFTREELPAMVFELLLPATTIEGMLDGVKKTLSYRELLERIFGTLNGDEEIAHKFLKPRCERYSLMGKGEQAAMRQHLTEICSGSTIIQADGRFLSHTGTIIEESSEVIRIIVKAPKWSGELDRSYCDNVRILVNLLIEALHRAIPQEEEVWCLEHPPVTLHQHVAKNEERHFDFEDDDDRRLIQEEQWEPGSADSYNILADRYYGGHPEDEMADHELAEVDE